MEQDLFRQVRLGESLNAAWNMVKKSGASSASKDIRNETSKFNENANANLKRIYNQLYYKRFKFQSRGILHKKNNRPIVIGTVAGRIVQRSILDVLQNQKAIKKYHAVPGSFGAIKNKGVPEAINKLKDKITNGATYYIKSDIQSFFTRVPFSSIANNLKSTFNDSAFLNLVQDAMQSEITNLNELNKLHKSKFDFSTHGVPQGCCLSPLFANMFLYEFDKLIENIDGVDCLRYLDDFVIVGSSQQVVNNAFTQAKDWLTKKDLSAYMPGDDSGKAAQGEIRTGLDFLGVHISGSKTQIHVKPASKKVGEFKNRIRELTHQNKSQITLGSMSQMLSELNKYLKAWGDQYHYCNNDDLFDSLDHYVSELLSNYFKAFVKKFHAEDRKVTYELRRLCGVHLLSDRKKI